MFVLELPAGLFRFAQNRPAPAPLFQLPPTLRLYPCESFTGRGGVRQGLLAAPASRVSPTKGNAGITCTI
jgi:hypothetical protein